MYRLKEKGANFENGNGKKQVCQSEERTDRSKMKIKTPTSIVLGKGRIFVYNQKGMRSEKNDIRLVMED